MSATEKDSPSSQFIWRTVFHWFFYIISVPIGLACYQGFILVAQPLKYFSKDWYYKYVQLCDKVYHPVATTSSIIADHKLYYCGDDITPCISNGARTAFISNHLAPEDILLKFDFFQSLPNTTQHTMWASFDPVKYSPLGTCVAMRGDFFLTQGKDKENREEHLEYVRGKLRDVFIPYRRFLIMYPEGGFPYSLRSVNDEFAAKYNLPKLQHTVLPRVGAMKAFMDVLAPENGKQHLDYVVDITLAHQKIYHYFFLGFGLRFPNVTGFLMRVYKVTDIPKDEAGLKKWMYDRWIEKDAFIDEFYKTGKFPDYGTVKPTFVQKDMKKIYLANAFNLLLGTAGAINMYLMYMNMDLSFLRPYPDYKFLGIF